MNSTDEIKTVNFSKLSDVIWKEKLLIIIITSLFFILGIYYAFNKVDEYVSKGELLPEISGGGSSSFGGLASMVGLSGLNLNLENSSEAIRPDLYPNILQSTPFFLNLLKQKVTTKNKEEIIFEDYLSNTFEKDKDDNNEVDTKKQYSLKDTSIIIISKLNENRIETLKKRINSSIDRKSGVITISSKMPDPLVAAQITEFTMDYLANYVKKYRTEKLQNEVDFLQGKVNKARGSYYSVQSQKAAYEDAFSAPTIRLQSADIKRERLSDEYQMTSTLYKELLKQLEEAKLKLQQETPVLQVLEPPIVPNYKSEPSRVLIILIFLLIGFIIATILALIIKKNYLKILN